MTLSVELGIRTVSETNQREHWAERSRRRKAHRGTANTVMRQFKAPEPPLVVTLTRLAPRRLDSDNLTSSMKAVRDGVADWLKVDDGDERITWLYAQEKAKGYGVRIEVAPAEAESAAS